MKRKLWGKGGNFFHCISVFFILLLIYFRSKDFFIWFPKEKILVPFQSAYGCYAMLKWSAEKRYGFFFLDIEKLLRKNFRTRKIGLDNSKSPCFADAYAVAYFTTSLTQMNSIILPFYAKTSDFVLKISFIPKQKKTNLYHINADKANLNFLYFSTVEMIYKD
jgi:hypothetical protein